MKCSWKNIESWRSWKMRFFGSAIVNFFFQQQNFFCFISVKTSSPFIRGIIYFCTMDGFFRILEKTSSELICTQLYINLTVHNIFNVLCGRVKNAGIKSYRQCNGDQFWPKIAKLRYVISSFDGCIEWWSKYIFF